MELDVGLAGGGDGLRLVVVDTGGSRLVGLDLGGAGWGGVGRRGGGGGGGGGGALQQGPCHFAFWVLSLVFLSWVHLKCIHSLHFEHSTDKCLRSIVFLQTEQVQTGPGFDSIPLLNNRSLSRLAGSLFSFVLLIKNSLS